MIIFNLNYETKTIAMGENLTLSLLDIKKYLQKIFQHIIIRLVKTKYGSVAQLVRALACHARGREFEPRRSRHF